MRTDDGVRLSVRRWVAERPTGAVAVLVHGFSASKDAATVARVAEALTADGNQVISYTARGHGTSGGRCTLGDLEHLDVAAAARLARADADRVVLVGASMGAIAVLRHAAQTPPEGIVTVSSPAEWSLPRTVQSVGAAALTQTGVGRWIARRALGVRLADSWSAPPTPMELAGRIAVPHAIVHGRKDAFIRHHEARKLHDAASEPCRLEIVDGMGHAYVATAVPAVRSAVRWTLDARDPSAGEPSAPSTSTRGASESS